jgi:hypothetical protein
MKEKCAICFRGKCKDTNLNCKSNKLEVIDYKKCIKSIFENIINHNKNYDFDLYLHGWIQDEKDKETILNDYKPKKFILEKQKDFTKDYITIKNYEEILKERYKHLHNKNVNYSNIHFQDYFQNIFSYAYSISKVVELIEESIDYKFIIHVRYDVLINSKINLNLLNKELIYTDDVKNSHSPLFYGDFIYISNKKNILFFKNFYDFLKTNIFNNLQYKNWVKTIINKKLPNSTGRYEHGIYSNQMIYAYFISYNFILYNNVIPNISCLLKKMSWNYK